MTRRFDPEQPEKSIDDWFAEQKVKQHFAKLQDRRIIPCSLTEWAMWDPERKLRQIGRYETDTHLVSTVFLGLDHAFYCDVRPQWFETMIFNKSTKGQKIDVDGVTFETKIGDDIYTKRYSTLAEAERGHQAAIIWLKEELAKKG
jgi:hypothetical protein